MTGVRYKLAGATTVFVAVLFVTGVIGGSHRHLSAAEMAALRGGAPMSCAGFKDCGIACTYKEALGQCQACLPPAGGTTQYPACISPATGNCDLDTANTGNCGRLSTSTSTGGGSDKCIVSKVSVCPNWESNPACLTYNKVKADQTPCNP